MSYKLKVGCETCQQQNREDINLPGTHDKEEEVIFRRLSVTKLFVQAVLIYGMDQ